MNAAAQDKITNHLAELGQKFLTAETERSANGVLYSLSVGPADAREIVFIESVNFDAYNNHDEEGPAFEATKAHLHAARITWIRQIDQYAAGRRTW